jgi:chromosome partitioning protein
MGPRSLLIAAIRSAGEYMKATSVINFKGGVGKTTLAFHLACHLSLSGKTLLVDVDHQSSMSLIVLGSQLWNDCVTRNATVNTIFESFTLRGISFPGWEIIVQNAMHQRNRGYDPYPDLDFVPAQFELDDTEIDLASTNYGNAVLSDWDKRTLISLWLDGINAQQHYQYVVFDCPPATKIVSQNALAASNSYIVPVIPDELSSRGVAHFQGLVQRKIDDKLKYLQQNSRGRIPASYVPDTKMAAIVPFLIKQSGNAASGMTNIHTEQLASLRRAWGSAMLDKVGLNYIGVPEAVNGGWPVWDWDSPNAAKASGMMVEICDALKARIDVL